MSLCGSSHLLSIIFYNLLSGLLSSSIWFHPHSPLILLSFSLRLQAEICKADLLPSSKLLGIILGSKAAVHSNWPQGRPTNLTDATNVCNCTQLHRIRQTWQKWAEMNSQREREREARTKQCKTPLRWRSSHRKLVAVHSNGRRSAQLKSHAALVHLQMPATVMRGNNGLEHWNKEHISVYQRYKKAWNILQLRRIL